MIRLAKDIAQLNEAKAKPSVHVWVCVENMQVVFIWVDPTKLELPHLSYAEGPFKNRAMLLCVSFINFSLRPILVVALVTLKTNK